MTAKVEMFVFARIGGGALGPECSGQFEGGGAEGDEPEGAGEEAEGEDVVEVSTETRPPHATRITVTPASPLHMAPMLARALPCESTPLR